LVSNSFEASHANADALSGVEAESLPSALSPGLIVSCQPVRGGQLVDPAIVAALVRAAEAGGARGIRVEGLADLRAAREATSLPLVGLVKGEFSLERPFITTERSQVRELAAAGADVIAFDGTARPRPFGVAETISEIHQFDRRAMADCATYEDGVAAAAAGADYVATTLSGYTSTTQPRTKPDFTLIRRLAEAGATVIAEGNIRTPEHAVRSYSDGSFAATVGSAITRPELITEWLAAALSSSAAGRPDS
jgi:putative N-acetylmannosamine-6-phosphate epimerase